MTTPNDNTPPSDGSPQGHADAMAAKFDQAQAAAGGGQQTETNSAQPERPSWLPEKFATPEAMAEAYAALEAKQSAPKESAPTGEPPANADEAKQQVEQAGLDFDALTTEFTEKGELSTETYDKLAKAGIPKATVDAYIAGQQALAEKEVSAVLADIGGPEAYTKLVNWAKTGLSKAEIDAFNTAMDTGTTESIKLAVAGLKARYDAAMGVDPNLLNGGNGESNTDVFRSVAEMTAAMKDPKYQRDPAYRRDVQEKLGRSNIL